eukprot:105753-Prymnesium_polylepis.1
MLLMRLAVGRAVSCSCSFSQVPLREPPRPPPSQASPVESLYLPPVPPHEADVALLLLRARRDPTFVSRAAANPLPKIYQNNFPHNVIIVWKSLLMASIQHSWKLE